MHTARSHTQAHAACSRRLLCIFALVMAFTCQPAWAAGPYTYGGDVVTDTSTGLVWKRCSAGQTWGGGTCNNTATAMAHDQALVYAAGQTGWRLPNVKELASIVDTSRISPAIDILAFPNTVSNAYWSSTPEAEYSSRAWVVGFDGGYVGIAHSRYSPYLFYVRLVR